MNNKVKNLATIGIFFLSLAANQSVFSYSSGISGYSGNPNINGGNDCMSCHSGGTVPTVELTGPSSVQPGDINTYTLKISGGQQNSGGLDISVDDGILISTIASTKLQAGEITHTQRATAAGDGTVSWNFNWQAPTTAGTYTIYSAGLSTNGISGENGDAVATSATVIDVTAAAAQSPTAVIQAPLTATVNSTVSFDGSGSFDPDGVINQYDWDFGDGNTATSEQAINEYTAAGTYTVTLTVTDSDLLTDTTFQDITVGGIIRPVADLSAGEPYNGIVGQPVTLDGSQSNHVSAITNYIWDFGDDTPVVSSTIATISHTYNTDATYTVTLAVQDANNITGVTSTTVQIGTVSGEPTPIPELDGPTLYANNCATCHQPLATSEKLNRTATQIQGAIDANTGNMGAFSTLTPEQVQAIADALVNTAPPTPTPTDGPTLYANRCAGCHNPLATSTKLNRSATQIQAAIDADTGNMGTIVGDLTPTEVQAIADALVTDSPPPAPTDGPTLYANNCSTCHQPLATSEKLNRSATQIQDAIDSNTGTMNSLSGLTPTEVQAIADALVNNAPPTPAPTDGQTLYANRCSGCHNPLASSNKLNRSAAQIQAAIDANTGNMGTIVGDLTPTEVQAIADALVNVTPPSEPTTGEGLYDSYCLVCHGPGGTGGQYEAVTGESANSITDAINSEQLM